MNDTGLAPIEDLAKFLRISVSTVRAWVAKGYIPRSTYLKVGKTYRFNLNAVISALRKIDNDQVAEVAKKNPKQLELDL